MDNGLYRKTFLSLILLTGAALSSAGTRPVHFDPAVVNSASTQTILKERDQGSAALRAQILLDRAHHSVGEIDGRVGLNTLRAVDGLRAPLQWAAAPVIDEPIWMLLNADPSPALVEYVLANEDLRGPFTRIPRKMESQSKLKRLGYQSVLEGMAEKFHCSPQLLRALNPQSDFSKAGASIMVPNVRTPLLGNAARVVISKASSTVSVYDPNGKLLSTYPSTSGSEHDPLPIGDWNITVVLKDPPFHYNPDLFWDANPKDHKATIAPGPNNPVGSVWIDLSKEHYGIHGTPSPSSIGYAQSHGCIRLTNWDALELAGLVVKGTAVRIEE